MVKKFTFANKNEFSQLTPLKNEIIDMPGRNLVNKNEVFVLFNTIKSEILVIVADPHRKFITNSKKN